MERVIATSWPRFVYLASPSRSFSPKSNNCAASVSAFGSCMCGRCRMPGCLRWGFFPRKSDPLSTWDTPGTRAAYACRQRKKQKGCPRHRRGRSSSESCLWKPSSPPAVEDALTRDWGPRRLRHDLQNISIRSLGALAVAMASGHTGNGSTRACDPQPRRLRASSVDLRPGRDPLMRRGSIC